ncbi:MAG: hypothetical protein AB9907_04380 [Flexilinea sp.]|jgi:NADH:ubiquinone oxidoreductase subunit 3 (subunit A)
MNILMSPPVAFMIYVVLGAGIVLYGQFSAPTEDTALDQKRSLYGSGEVAPEERGVPGYKPFLLISLFFAILHLGVLVVGLSDLSSTSVIYLVALMLGLVALMLG